MGWLFLYEVLLCDGQAPSQALQMLLTDGEHLQAFLLGHYQNYGGNLWRTGTRL